MMVKVNEDFIDKLVNVLLDVHDDDQA